MTNSRTKGKNGELEVVHLFRRWFPDARRGARQAGGGSEGADVIGTPYWIEVKRHKKITKRLLDKAWAQAVRDMEVACEREIIPDLMPILVVARGDYGEWRVVLAKHFNVYSDMSWNEFQSALDEQYPIQTEAL